MKIDIEFGALLNIEGMESGSYIEIMEGTTIADLLTKYNIKEEHQQYIILSVNGEQKRLSYVLQEDDSLSLYLPIGGG